MCAQRSFYKVSEKSSPEISLKIRTLCPNSVHTRSAKKNSEDLQDRGSQDMGVAARYLRPRHLYTIARDGCCSTTPGTKTSRHNQLGQPLLASDLRVRLAHNDLYTKFQISPQDLRRRHLNKPDIFAKIPPS